MRSDIVKQGDSRAAHRGLLRACGVGENDFNKPFIAICCSYTDIVPGHVHLNDVAEYLKQCVREAGGVPFVFNTIAVDDGIAMGHPGMKFSLASRELIADCVETMVTAHCFDGMICVPNCDKIVPGMLMGAIRCNIPTVFASGGPMEAGRKVMPGEPQKGDNAKGERGLDLIDIFVAAAAKQKGDITAEQLTEIEKAACPTCGSCSGMFTANSMNCLCEALGMALPTNGSLLATSAERKRLFKKAAQRVIQMVKDLEDGKTGFLPCDIININSIDNAIVLDMAMGGSTNTVLHTMAIANEAGIPYDIKRINDLSNQTPNVCKVSPSCHYHMEDVHNSSGIHTILGSIARGKPGLLHLDAMTVTGKTLGENIAQFDLRADTVSQEALELYAVQGTGRRNSKGMSVEREAATVRDLTLGFDPYDCIREVENAYSQVGGLAILHGNLAPNGAVVKSAGGLPRCSFTPDQPSFLNRSRKRTKALSPARSKPGTSLSFGEKAPKAGRECRKCSPPRPQLKASSWTIPLHSLQTVAFQAAPLARALGTSPLKRRLAVRSLCSETATSSTSTFPPESSTSA